jgi:hypothetical protein
MGISPIKLSLAERADYSLDDLDSNLIEHAAFKQRLALPNAHALLVEDWDSPEEAELHTVKRYLTK